MRHFSAGILAQNILNFLELHECICAHMHNVIAVYGQFEYSVSHLKLELDCFVLSIELAYFEWDIVGWSVTFELA